ncbi:MAG: hypothetical protein LE169_06025 [Endomicrobium sp.]|nr:hypothetical protein [Endomicrobium sp.]
MKKVISVCLCICLMSGCDKSLSHGRPVNTAVKDRGSEGVSTHSLTSDTPNASASTPEAQPASDSADTGISVGKYFGYAVALAFVFYGGYKLLYRFARFRPIAIDGLQSVKGMPEGYRKCYLCYLYDDADNYYLFDWDTHKFVEEIPLKEEAYPSYGDSPVYYYKSNSLEPNLLKTWLRKILRIKMPVSIVVAE